MPRLHDDSRLAPLVLLVLLLVVPPPLALPPSEDIIACDAGFVEREEGGLFLLSCETPHKRARRTAGGGARGRVLLVWRTDAIELYW